MQELYLIIILLNAYSDGEFTQMMKGLQGERLRQAFKFLDHDQDGFILPDQFKRIIMVRTAHQAMPSEAEFVCRKLLATNFPMV